MFNGEIVLSLTQFKTYKLGDKKQFSSINRSNNLTAAHSFEEKLRASLNG